jgi:hypothetical protein
MVDSGAQRIGLSIKTVINVQVNKLALRIDVSGLHITVIHRDARVSAIEGDETLCQQD